MLESTVALLAGLVRKVSVSHFFQASTTWMICNIGAVVVPAAVLEMRKWAGSASLVRTEATVDKAAAAASHAGSGTMSAA
jgi:hypothetical protein